MTKSIVDVSSNKITRKQKQNSAAVASAVVAIKDSESKKREDLTSLGSDDSGMRKIQLLSSFRKFS